MQKVTAAVHTAKKSNKTDTDTSNCLNVRSTGGTQKKTWKTFSLVTVFIKIAKSHKAGLMFTLKYVIFKMDDFFVNDDWQLENVHIFFTRVFPLEHFVMMIILFFFLNGTSKKKFIVSIVS